MVNIRKIHFYVYWSYDAKKYSIWRRNIKKDKTKSTRRSLFLFSSCRKWKQGLLAFLYICKGIWVYLSVLHCKLAKSGWCEVWCEVKCMRFLFDGDASHYMKSIVPLSTHSCISSDDPLYELGDNGGVQKNAETIGLWSKTRISYAVKDPWRQAAHAQGRSYRETRGVSCPSLQWHVSTVHVQIYALV